MSAVAPAAKGIAFSATATPPPVAAAAAVATSSTTVVPGRGALFAALTDALAGALGSVVAVAVFYPIDVAKTRAQASSSTSPLPSSDHACENRDAASRRGSSKGVAGGRETGWLRSRTLSALVSLVRNEGVSRLYEGIEAKALQSLLGSFIYFYAYAFIKGAMRRRMQRGGGGVPGGSSKALRPSLNLLAAALAGAINQIVTLPLENITTRMQTAQRTPPSSAGDDEGSTWAPRKSPATPRDNRAGSGHSAATAVAVAARTACNGSRLSVSANDAEETEVNTGGFCSEAADNRREGSSGGDDDHHAAASGGGGDIPGFTVSPPGNFTGAVANGGENTLSQVAMGGLNGIVQQPVKFLRGGAGNDKEDGIVGGEEIGRDRPDGNISDASAVTSCLPGRELQHQRERRQRQSLLTVAAELYREGGGIARFWRGFVPSLVLTCNPAINYTAFDLLKALWLRRRAAAETAAAISTTAAAGVGASPRGSPSTPGAAGSASFLDPVEAFLVAAAAKSLATLSTYPLIRAKVVLMTSSRRTSLPSSCSCSCSSRPSYCFPAAGGPSVAATGEETTAIQPNASALARRRKEGTFKRDGDGDCQQRRDDSTTEDVGGGAVGIRQQECARGSVSGKASSSSPATAESCVRNGSDATAATAVAPAAGWEGMRGGGVDGDVRGMSTVMLDIFRREGIGGLYTGCGAQLLHTILKSALHLATKEQIERAAASAVLLL